MEDKDKDKDKEHKDMCRQEAVMTKLGKYGV